MLHVINFKPSHCILHPLKMGKGDKPTVLFFRNSVSWFCKLVTSLSLTPGMQVGRQVDGHQGMHVCRWMGRSPVRAWSPVHHALTCYIAAPLWGPPRVGSVGKTCRTRAKEIMPIMHAWWAGMWGCVLAAFAGGWAGRHVHVRPCIPVGGQVRVWGACLQVGRQVCAG